mgnify:CR=1 FL=1
MRKYFTEVTNYFLQQLENDNADLYALRDELLLKISFMQHERFIHLIVTVLFALLLFISMIIFFVSEIIGFLAVTALMLALLIPYIAHYFFLENGVQRLYGIYDRLYEKIKTAERSGNGR